jgi:uncharacterized membrane protein YhaH (DUF805 family)
MEVVVGNAISVCMSKYAVFTGRASRSEYWYFVLFTQITYWGIKIIGAVGGSTSLEWALLLINWALFLVPLFAVGTRRMHDVGKSGGFYLIPIYNIVLLAQASTSDNVYGAKRI